MTIDNFLAKLKLSAESVEFSETMDVVSENYIYTPAGFGNGLGDSRVFNAAGTNEGSCKLFAFAKLNNLDKEETLACFGTYYREDVLKNPLGEDHSNIRNFMRDGWDGIVFDANPLEPH